MHRAIGSNEPARAQRARMQGLRSRAQELERMLEIGSYDTLIRQREAEIQSLRQRKALLESELQRLRRTLGEIADA